MFFINIKINSFEKERTAFHGNGRYSMNCLGFRPFANITIKKRKDPHQDIQNTII